MPDISQQAESKFHTSFKKYEIKHIIVPALHDSYALTERKYNDEF